MSEGRKACSPQTSAGIMKEVWKSGWSWAVSMPPSRATISS